ncbi:hypothetical protein [Acidovorax sp.]|jgi:hypothetical protein|uniref:hypothetical protein n=1 Tax=Acidovorax sp. TaxID=1872122 RepID=UPI00391F07A9
MISRLRKILGLAATILVINCSLINSTHANEVIDRERIRSFFAENFENGDFSALEQWYTKALKEKTRMESGNFQASILVRSIEFKSDKKCDVSKCPKVDEKFWLAQEKKAKEWLVRYPKSTLAAIALARIYSKQAWIYRGTGYANTVAKEDWKMFHGLMHRAVEVLNEQQVEGRKDPHWWASLLAATFYGSVDPAGYQQLTNNAINAFPDNTEIYITIAYTLLPQWGGSHSSIAALASEAVNKTKATDGEAFYARIYWGLVDSLGRPGFLKPGVDWPRIRSGFDDMLQRYPGDWNLNAYARLACLEAHDKKTTARLMRRIGENPLGTFWQDRITFKRCQQWALEEIQ